MQLVSFLVSGVRGAENGTATFLLRGTASSAASVLYNDFEGTTQPGTNIITLDANGAAEVYTNAYCDVVLKTSGGTTLRTVTVGNAATNVEVISDSFTGTSYSGSPTASSQPITLASVLDKWDDSAGADDWKVSIGGVATNLSSAFAALAGLFFNVKDEAYGALGDGVTDDTTAIGLAITAAANAGGGIVFFPASTSFYKFTTLTLSSNNVTLMGAGTGSSVLKSASTSAVITVSATGPIRFSDLSVTGTGANASPLLEIGSGANLYVRNCDFTGSAYTGSLIRKVSGSVVTQATFDRCTFTHGSSGLKVVENAANDGRMTFNLTRCKFSYPASYAGYGVFGPDFIVSDCVFDGSALTGATFTAHINAASNSTAGKYLGQFVNNRFLDGGSASVVFLLTSIAADSQFLENNNKFEGFTAPTEIDGTELIYSISHNAEGASNIVLGSRRGRTISITQSSGGAKTPSILVGYEHVFVTYTAAANMTLTMPISSSVNGMDVFMVILNSSGASRDITVDVGESVQTYGATVGNSFASGNDSTVSPSDGERCIIKGKFGHFTTGSPLFLLEQHLED